MPQVHCLLVGDPSAAEFYEPLRELNSRANVVHAASLEEAIALAFSGVVADLIVLAQSRPGQYSAEAVDRLRGFLPLARVIGLLGSWCEGEVRTGHPWPAAIRVYWHQAAAQFGQELDCLRAGKPSVWSLPVTAGEEERTLAAAEQSIAQDRGRVVVCSAEVEMQNWVCATCRRGGYSPVRLRPDRLTRMEGVRAAVFDGTDGCQEEFEQLKTLVDAVRPAGVVAMLNFPRAEDRDRIRAAGAATLASKPLLPEDLLWHLRVCGAM